MNISYNWLKDIIDLDLTAEETAAALTRVGLAIEGIHPHGDDLIFDIDLTSNRPDCLSHLGVARELGVITGAEIRPVGSSPGAVPSIDAVPFPAVLAPEIVKIEAPELCSRFTARIIRNVKIGPSPEWLINRLEAIGERSINNIADITNYVMHELGQPMHAFDLDKLAGSRIVVRRAAAGDTITTLDEVERKLDDSVLAICDAEKPAAVAGVMGGMNSGITDETTNVLLEVAYFDRDNIRQTSRKLGLATEASYRFERGVDIENLIRASYRATELIVELAGGEAADLIDIYPSRHRAQTVASSDLANAVTRLSGLEVPPADCDRILTDLGITPSGDGTFSSPSWRHDIAIEEDLVEEVVRHSGYENIGNQLPPAYGAGELAPNEDRKRQIRRTLTDLGFIEAIGYSFIDTRHDGRFELIPEIAGRELVELRDSVIEGAVRMRPTMIPGLLEALKTNFNQQRRDLKLFEIGKVFAASSAGKLPIEREIFAFAVTGGETFGERSLTGRELDFYDAKGSFE
ncbi:MAG: phenylalanine--tRNA ligase subunit beta, partial [Blastocatellia bacterium]|nr:phenylalanine--tRNA ligase subunit beta [Blastocatellia bacterium]